MTTDQIGRLEALIAASSEGLPTDFDLWKERARAGLAQVYGSPDDPEVKRFMLTLVPGIIKSPHTVQSGQFAQAQLKSLSRARAILLSLTEQLSTMRSATIDQKSDDWVDAAAGFVASLHPWIADAVVALWTDGHHRQAVDEATRAIELRLRNKVNKDLAGYDLVTQAFRIDDPVAGETRLRFPEVSPGTQEWTNTHQGTMLFAQGCMMRIRNLLEHYDHEVEPQVAVEALSALSLLARWTDAAVVVHGSTPA